MCVCGQSIVMNLNLINFEIQIVTFFNFPEWGTSTPHANLCSVLFCSPRIKTNIFVK